MPNEKSDTSNLIRLVDPRYQDRLSEASEGGSLELFLDALNYVVESKVQDDSALEVWPQIARRAGEADALKQVLSWLGTLRFPRKNSPGTLHQEPDDLALIQARELGKEFPASFADMDKAVKHEPDSPQPEPFQPFLSATPIKDLLADDEFRPIARACKTIARHISSLHGPSSDDDQETFVVRQAWLRRFVDEDLLPWVEAVARERHSEGERVPYFHAPACLAFPYLTAILAEEVVVDEDGIHPAGFSPELIHHLLPYVPQALFDVLVEFLIDQDFLLDGKTDLYAFDVLTCLPIGAMPDSSMPFRRTIPPDSALYEKRHLFRARDEVPVMSWENLSKLVFHFYLHVGSISALVREEDEYADGCIWTPARLARRLQYINDEVTRYRLVYGQAIPYEEELTAHFASSIFDMSEELRADINLDISLWLAGSAAAGIGGPGYESGVNTPFTPSQYSHLGASSALALRSRVFKQAITRAEQDGLYALAEALLMFFIFTQSLYAQKVSIIDWSWVGDFLSRFLRFPGSDDLNQCLEICLELAKGADSHKEFDRLNLEFYQQRISDSTSVERAADVREVLVNWEASERKEARKFLEEAVGKKHRQKVSKQEFNELIDAETSYRQLKLTASGRGCSGTDVSQVTIGYWRPFEKILHRVFHQISDLPNFNNLVGLYGRRGSLTVSKVLRVFLQAASFPETVQMHLSKKHCYLGMSPDYQLDWLDKFRRLRNQATHEGGVPFQQLEKIHDLMYEQDYLARFFKALPLLEEH